MSEGSKISVLMSVYEKERPSFLKLAIESMLNQTVIPDEFVIVEDGPLTADLYATLDALAQQSSVPFKRYALEQNVGLGLALRYGLERCTYDYVARMDSDDISIPERLALQLEAMNTHDVDIVGGHIAEFIDNVNEHVALRKVPLVHEEIVKYQRMRSAFNHVTVMFKKEVALRAGNYEDGLYMEDDLLWLNMIDIHAKMMNIDKVLCYVRVGAGMFERRGGMKYFNLYKEARKRMYHRHQISWWEYMKSILFQILVALLPKVFRKFIFLRLLREKE